MNLATHLHTGSDKEWVELYPYSRNMPSQRKQGSFLPCTPRCSKRSLYLRFTYLDRVYASLPTMHDTRFAYVILVDLITLKYLARAEIMEIIIRLPRDSWLQNNFRQIRTTYENAIRSCARDSCSMKCRRCTQNCIWQRCVLPTGKIETLYAPTTRTANVKILAHSSRQDDTSLCSRYGLPKFF